MPIQIDVHESHIQSLIQFYFERLKTLRVEITAKELELKEITLVIQKLKRGSANGNTQDNIGKVNIDYSESWPWARKVEFAIELKEKPLSTKEIVDILTEFEPSFLIDRKRVVASISSILSSKSGEGKEFKRVESDTGDFKYIVNEKIDKAKEDKTTEDDDSMPW